MERRKLVINRRIWLRGEPSGEGIPWKDFSQLHRVKDGKMCCVGIYLHACGVPMDALAGIGEADLVLAENDETSDDESKTYVEEACWLISSMPTDPAPQLYATNDDDQLAGFEREQIIKEIFAQHGVDVEFVG